MPQTRSGPGTKTRATADTYIIPADIVAPTSLHRYPAAYATAYGPAGRRKRAAGMIRCPYCRGGHLAYAASIDQLRGVKRAGCGNGRYWVVIALTVNVDQAVNRAA